MENWIAMLAALGAGGILAKLFDNVVAWFRGRQKEQRDAWHERDREAKARRILEEYAHRLRAILLRLGAREGTGSDDIPPWPDYTTR